MSARTVVVACAVLFGALAAGRTPVRAQNREARHVRGRVVLIAGADLHVELSEPAPLHAGDTLVVRRDATTRGALVVVAADSLRALTSFAGTPFALTRGERFEAELRPGAGPVRVAAAPARTDSAAARGVAAYADTARTTPPPTPTPPATRGARVSGYLTSETRWVQQSTDGTSSSYGMPTATLSLRMSDLPARAQVEVFARAEHYTGSPPGFAADRTTQLQVYAARVTSQFGLLRVALGRLTPTHDPFAGTWDGLALRVGNRVSLAAEAGWQPERSTGTPSFTFPRAALSLEARADAGRMRYRGSVSALRYLDGAPVGRGTLGIATRHALSTGPLRISGDVRAESSLGESLTVRWGGANASLTNARGLSVHAGYRHYTPVAPVGLDTLTLADSLLVADSLVDTSARHRIDGGVYLPLGRVALSVTATTTPGAEHRSSGAHSQLFVRALPGALDLELSGGLWQWRETRTITAGVALARSTGRVYTRAGYRFERGNERGSITAHEIEGDIAVTVARRSSLGLYLLHSTAGSSAGSQAHLRLTWGF